MLLTAQVYESHAVIVVVLLVLLLIVRSNVSVCVHPVAVVFAGIVKVYIPDELYV